MTTRSVLIAGKSTTGKSASLRNLKNPETVLYMNTESNKELPFPHKFKYANITDPNQIPTLFSKAEEQGEACQTLIIDSITFMMDMYESMHVINSSNTMQGWSNYAQFFKTLMQNHVANSTKNIIMLGHTLTTFNDDQGFMETSVPVKGASKNQGLEAYFSTVIATKQMALTDLENYNSPLLNITEEEEELGYKHVFQTRLTKKTIHERIRSPMGMWKAEETFIDNDAQLVLDRMDQYYGK